MGNAQIMLAIVSLAALTACESEAKKCIDTTNKTYEREVAACKDDACKAAAAKSKADFLEICNKK
jgi:hypothetical protein